MASFNEVSTRKTTRKDLDDDQDKVQKKSLENSSLLFHVVEDQNWESVACFSAHQMCE